MIKVNNIELPWREAYTISEFYEAFKDDRRVFKYPGHGMIVIVNNCVLGASEKHSYVIQLGDVIQIIMPSGGG